MREQGLDSSRLQALRAFVRGDVRYLVYRYTVVKFVKLLLKSAFLLKFMRCESRILPAVYVCV